MAANMAVKEPIRRIEVFVFYFDVSGLVDQFISHGNDALARLRRFQRRARREFPFERDHSYVVTLYDNVWSRVNASEPGLPSLLLDFAARVMDAAESEGFASFFGAITRGIHDFNPNDRMLVGGSTFEDLREQHLDVTSEAHIRAAYAEKWHVVSSLPRNCVWVSSEAVEPGALPAQAGFLRSAFRPYGEEFDLALAPLTNGRSWPFPQSARL